jgi:hypothetical protein
MLKVVVEKRLVFGGMSRVVSEDMLHCAVEY